MCWNRVLAFRPLLLQQAPLGFAIEWTKAQLLKQLFPLPVCHPLWKTKGINPTAQLPQPALSLGRPCLLERKRDPRLRGLGTLTTEPRSPESLVELGRGPPSPSHLGKQPIKEPTIRAPHPTNPNRDGWEVLLLTAFVVCDVLSRVQSLRLANKPNRQPPFVGVPV